MLFIDLFTNFEFAYIENSMRKSLSFREILCFQQPQAGNAKGVI